MKCLTVKFTRNPKYTPASLSEHQLSRIEWLVKAFLERDLARHELTGWDVDLYGKQALDHMTKNWFTPLWSFDRKPHPVYGSVEDYSKVEARKADHDKRWAWLLEPDASRYFVNCYNYLIAVAKNHGEVKEPARCGRAEWAQIRGSY